MADESLSEQLASAITEHGEKAYEPLLKMMGKIVGECKMKDKLGITTTIAVGYGNYSLDGIIDVLDELPNHVDDIDKIQEIAELHEYVSRNSERIKSDYGM